MSEIAMEENRKVGFGKMFGIRGRGISRGTVTGVLGDFPDSGVSAFGGV